MIVKVCGMRDASNIRAIDNIEGVDWMGFIFYPRSPRYVAAPPAYLPQHSKRVGVFVNSTSEDIVKAAETFHLDMIQLHGHETPDDIFRLRPLLAPGTKIIKMVAVSSPADAEQAKAYDHAADYLLFETKCQGYGGSGQQFDWSTLQAYQGSTPFLLTGGIGPDDAERVASFRHPRFAGVDLNSRFETSPALKDAESVAAFVKKTHNQ